MQLKRNPSIELSEDEPIQVPPPENVRAGGYSIIWDFSESSYNWHGPLDYSIVSILFNNGILGAGLEIKHAGAGDFTPVRIQNFYGGPAWFFDINLSYAHYGLTEGTHIARIKHLGGPFVQWGAWDSSYRSRDGKIMFSLDSQPLYFNVTVDSNRKIISIEQQL